MTEVSKCESYLVLIRHGQSEWNKLNLFTGLQDIPLTSKGQKEAQKAGKSILKIGVNFDVSFTSALCRAKQTMDIVEKQLEQKINSNFVDAALNERDYGNLTGMNKDEARKKWGDDVVHRWRRSYSARPPGGESLEDTAKRVHSYWYNNIKPLVDSHKNILVVAHGNSLRALIMLLDNLNQMQISEIELQTGAPIVYIFDKKGRVQQKIQNLVS